MNKKIKALTPKEINELKDVLNLFENLTYSETGVHRISGGFAKAEMMDYDKDKVYLELTWGVQSDCHNSVHTENWHITRTMLNSDAPLKKKVASIDN